jgi:hypothetical protein
VSEPKVGGWKREKVRKGEWWSKGIESTSDGEMRTRGAALAQRGACPQTHGANWRAGAKCASQGREMAFGEEDGVVGRARVGDHLHRGEPRWILDEMPFKERERA